MKNIFIILIIFFYGCDFKPVYIKGNESGLEFNKIISIGDEKLNRLLVKTLGLKELSNNNLNLKLDSNYNILETSKNSRGLIETYKSIITINLIIESDGKIKKTKNFSKEFSYNSKDNKFELLKYQNKIKSNLSAELANEIYIYLKLQ